MASKEVMIVNPEEMGNLVLTDRAVDAYRFALAHAGIEMDEETEAEFIAQRNSKTEGFRDLNESMKWMGKAVDSIKESLKHTYNVGTEEELPQGIKWGKQGYTYAFADGAAEMVAQGLLDRGLVSITQLLQQMTVAQVAKASGLTTEKLIDLFPDTIIEKPKERTLYVK